MKCKITQPQALVELRCLAGRSKHMFVRCSPHITCFDMNEAFDDNSPTELLSVCAGWKSRLILPSFKMDRLTDVRSSRAGS